jgi:hypothetical protein
MANIILAGIQALDDQKGQIVDAYIYPVIGTSPNEIVAGFDLQNNLPVNLNNFIGNFSQRPNAMMI